jgi:predicted KAP-like P-loop ATPase
MFSRIRDWLRQSKPVEPLCAKDTLVEPQSAGAKEIVEVYSTDQPITRRDQDRFNRWPFAKRVAETIANGRDPSSIIVGVYGPWGDGKTSTLALMERAWADNPGVIPVRFNSWQFGSEEQLLRAFFNTLADALGKSLTKRKEDIGKILKKYGAILSIASLDLAHLVKLDPGKGIAALGEALSSVELDTLRGRLEDILVESGKRAVVLVDDIDRLDRSEIHAVFRLIKVSASFKNTSYVLAFDDDMVAAALGERYGGGGVTAGRNFLEKIVHVPLHLPPAETIELRKMAFEGVDSVLSQHDIKLSREEIERFSRMFVDAIEPQMTTPRQAKRFSNAISFAIPLLKGEANLVDLMIVEAIGIFFPKLYAAIRDNPSLFLGPSHDGGDTNKRVSHLYEFLAPTLEAAGVADKEIVYRRLIEPLFPRSGRIGHGSDWDSRWINEQRICSAEYFGRYFSYSVPPGDIGDIEVRQFIDGIGNASFNEEQVTAQMMRFAARRAMPGLLNKLRSQEDTLEPTVAWRLAVAIAPHGGLLPKEEGDGLLGRLSCKAQYSSESYCADFRCLSARLSPTPSFKRRNH